MFAERTGKRAACIDTVTNLPNNLSKTTSLHLFDQRRQSRHKRHTGV
jgi:hypothetical protein